MSAATLCHSVDLPLHSPPALLSQSPATQPHLPWSPHTLTCSAFPVVTHCISLLLTLTLFQGVDYDTLFTCPNSCSCQPRPIFMRTNPSFVFLFLLMLVNACVFEKSVSRHFLSMFANTYLPVFITVIVQSRPCLLLHLLLLCSRPCQ